MSDLNELRRLSGVKMVFENNPPRVSGINVTLSEEESQRLQEMFLALVRGSGKEDVLDPLWSERLTRELAYNLKELILSGDLLETLWKNGKLKRLLDEVPF